MPVATRRLTCSCSPPAAGAVRLGANRWPLRRDASADRRVRQSAAGLPARKPTRPRPRSRRRDRRPTMFRMPAARRRPSERGAPSCAGNREPPPSRPFALLGPHASSARAVRHPSRRRPRQARIRRRARRRDHRTLPSEPRERLEPRERPVPRERPEPRERREPRERSVPKHQLSLRCATRLPPDVPRRPLVREAPDGSGVVRTAMQHGCLALNRRARGGTRARVGDSRRWGNGLGRAGRWASRHHAEITTW